ncbi:MAG: PPOX class F420-dependent oxidoreductase [Ardenticatenaceae bacterium]
MANSDFDAKPIPESGMDLIERPLVMALATTLADGTPQVTPVWFSYEDGHILFNSARGRLKDRAIRANPYVAMTIVDPNNPYHYVAIRGPVVEITEEGAREHINALAKRYTGRDTFSGSPDEVRVIYRLKPQHVLAQ